LMGCLVAGLVTLSAAGYFLSSFLGAAFLAAAFFGAAFLGAAFFAAAFLGAALASVASAFGATVRVFFTGTGLGLWAGAVLLAVSNFSPLPRIASIHSSVMA